MSNPIPIERLMSEELAAALELHALDDCGGKLVPTHLCNIAAAEYRALLAEREAMRSAMGKALGHISGGLCYLTAEAKHAQLLDAEKALRSTYQAAMGEGS